MPGLSWVKYVRRLLLPVFIAAVLGCLVAPTMAAAEPTIQTTTTVNCGTSVRFPGSEALCTAKVRSSGTGASAATGTVKLSAEGGQIPATCTLLKLIGPESVCQARYTPKDGGQQTIGASYLGSETHLPSSGQTTVVVSTTATSLTCRPGSIGVGASTVCTAEVKSTGGLSTSPSGTVGFASSEGLPEPSTCTLNESAACSVTFAPKAIGTRAIKATYEGDATHPPSSAETSVSVRGATKTTADCGPEVQFLGAEIKCAVKVESSGAGASAATGLITLTAGGQGVASCVLAPSAGLDSTAQCRYTPKESTLQKIIVTYGGDKTHLPSSANPTVVVSQPVTSLTCQPDSLALGEASTCTAEVKNVGAGPDILPGTVSFKSSNEAEQLEPSSCTPGAGRACSVTFAPKVAGVFLITATFGSDAAHPASKAEATVAAGRATATTVNCGQALRFPDTDASCLVRVKSLGAGATAPTGTVKLTAEGGSIPPTCTLIKLIGPESACPATYRTHIGGLQAISANYLGDLIHRPSNGQATVPVTDTTTSLTCEPESPALGETSTCTAEVKNAGAGPDDLSGTVSFKSDHEGQFAARTCSLGESDACTVKYLPEMLDTEEAGGRHLLTATYEGDATHPASHGEATLAVRSISVKLVCSAPVQGALGSCVARVVNEGRIGSRSLTGTVKFTTSTPGQFGTPVCTLLPFIDNEGGFCSSTYFPIVAGAHEISAFYSGDDTHPRASAKDQIEVADG
jgi:Bacterial Ig-like domain (group 3)